MTIDHGVSVPSGRLTHEVREVMTPGVVTIPADASLTQGYRAIAAHGVHAVLVVDRNTGSPLGWITAAGLLRWAVGESRQHSVGQTICEPVHTISPSATAREAAEMLLKPGVSHLLVAHYGAASGEGVISEVDVVRLVAEG